MNTLVTPDLKAHLMLSFSKDYHILSISSLNISIESLRESQGNMVSIELVLSVSFQGMK